MRRCLIVLGFILFAGQVCAFGQSDADEARLLKLWAMGAVQAPKPGIRICAVTNGASAAPAPLTPTAQPSEPR